jgi:hypothetical protein
MALQAATSEVSVSLLQAVIPAVTIAAAMDSKSFFICVSRRGYPNEAFLPVGRQGHNLSIGCWQSLAASQFTQLLCRGVHSIPAPEITKKSATFPERLEGLH